MNPDLRHAVGAYLDRLPRMTPVERQNERRALSVIWGKSNVLHAIRVGRRFKDVRFT